MDDDLRAKIQALVDRILGNQVVGHPPAPPNRIDIHKQAPSGKNPNGGRRLLRG